MSAYENLDDHGLRSWGRRAFVCIAGTAVAGALAIGLAGIPALATDTPEAESGAAVSTVVMDDVQYVTLAEKVAAQCIPSVGTVTGLVEDGYNLGIAMGSCVVYSSDGYIITNYHVIEGTSKIVVEINDTEYEAELVGSDPTSDIAVLKVDPGDEELIPMAIGSSSELVPGEWVMTVGAPMGEEHSVSQGIVSGLGRTTSMLMDDLTQAYYVGLIQTDAMINSGSSGGALVNSDGALVGITTINYSSTGDFAGMSAAIPSDYVVRLTDEIIANGVASHPFLGVSLSDVTPYNYQSAGASRYWGAYVAEVEEGSGAEAGGVQAGDVIMSIDGETVYSSENVIIGVRAHNVGEDVVLGVERDGEEMEITVTLGSDLDSELLASLQEEQEEIPSIFGNGPTDGYDSNWGWGFGGPGDGSWGYWSGPIDDGNGGYGYGFGFSFGNNGDRQGGFGGRSGWGYGGSY